MPDQLQNAPVVGIRKRFPRVFGRYILEKSLSRGGMGEVMLAVARHVNERCVIKTIRTDLTGDEEFVGRFADEAKIMVRIEHQNIIRVFDAGKVDHDYYIAMQYVHGRDLGDVLDRAYERGEPLPIGLGLYITDQLLRGLDYVHNLKDEHGRHMGLVHRDISPQNVLVGFDGSIKLIDFGLARTDVLPARTQGALAVGKYGYMSPEQARHESIDGRADIYSAGVMLFEVFTGDRLVDEQDQATLWQRVLSPKHRSPKTVIPTLPDIVERLIMQAVEVRPEGRFQTARQMRDFAARATSPDNNREALVRYLRYLYPKVDFSPPPVPKFDDLAGGTEQSIIIATSDKGALSVFGRGNLPIEWTMQLNAKQKRSAGVDGRRKPAFRREAVTDPNVKTSELDIGAEIFGSEPTLRRDPRDFARDAGHRTDDRAGHRTDHRTDDRAGQRTDHRTDDRAGHRTDDRAGHRTDHRTDDRTDHRTDHRTDDRTDVGAHDGAVEDRTQIAPRPTSGTSDTTRYVRVAPPDAQTPVAPLPTAQTRPRSPYRDDEMTVMMDAPPQARALFEGDAPTRLSRLPDDVPGPTVQPVPTAAPATKAPGSAPRRTIKEKNASFERPNRQSDPRPRHKKALEIHRRTFPVATPPPDPEPRPSLENYSDSFDQTLDRRPVPWMVWGLALLGLAVLVVAIVIFAVVV